MKQRSIHIAAIVFSVFFASAVSFAQGTAAADFKAKCALCHGDDGLGGTPMAKALGVPSYKSPEVRKMTDAELTVVIKNGKNNKMPPFGTQLSDTQIKDLLKFVHTLQK